MNEQSAYAAAGVDIEAGDRAVALMKEWVGKTRRPEVLGGIGGFAGLFDATRIAAMAHPVLATSTDGIGTKVAIAQAMGVHDTIGFDLVGMVVDDLVVCGAEPLFLTDYIACGKVEPERVAAIVKGIAEACTEAGCALLGGETAEHPGLLGPGSTTAPAPPRASSSATGSLVPSDSGRENGSSPGSPPGCPPTAPPPSGTCCGAGGAGRSTATSPSWGGRWGRSCWSRPACTPGTASLWRTPSRCTR